MRLLVSLLLTSCGEITPPDFYTEYGAAVYLNGSSWHTEDFRAQDAAFFKAIQESHPYLWPQIANSALQHLRVIITPNNFKCAAGMCAGIQQGNYIYVAARPCIDQSAYSHEVLHFLLFKVYGIEDLNHTNLTLWRIVDGISNPCLE